jgi:hypothetical protein
MVRPVGVDECHYLGRCRIPFTTFVRDQNPQPGHIEHGSREPGRRDGREETRPCQLALVVEADRPRGSTIKGTTPLNHSGVTVRDI